MVLATADRNVLEVKLLCHAAYTPNLDHLASLGMNGLYHTTMQGVPMSSETAHFIIFGYELKEFPGRGYIEAKGKGIPVTEE